MSALAYGPSLLTTGILFLLFTIAPSRPPWSRLAVSAVALACIVRYGWWRTSLMSQLTVADEPWKFVCFAMELLLLFDTAILFGNNFGLLGSRAKAKRVLRRLHQIISQGGLILAETFDPYGTEDPVHLAYHRRNRKRGRLPGEIRMRIRYKQYTTPWFDWLLVSKDEMRTLVQRTGFKMTGSLDSDGPRYVGILQNI